MGLGLSQISDQIRGLREIVMDVINGVCKFKIL